MNSSGTMMVKWLVVLAIPFFLGFSTIRLFINSAELFLQYEYGKESFPADLTFASEIQRQRLGLTPFTQAERLALAQVAVDYLQRPEPAEEVIFLLEEQELPGRNESLYNPDEISHMIDVKRLTDTIARLNWLAGAIVLVGLGVLLLREETRTIAYQAIFYGGVATTAVLLGLGLFIVLGWSIFFVQFHELLFPPGTWTFAYTDSLIRLFPEKFWFDFGVLVSVTALLSGMVTALVGYGLTRAAR
ncbi:MAG: DUF1461 domain-containing protein [Candidatus Promineifilaceae bacterium]|nr:DUF1461 domain-containing protein [Candidatus Promineifilaceae bacterium]